MSEKKGQAPKALRFGSELRRMRMSQIYRCALTGLVALVLSHVSFAQEPRLTVPPEARQRAALGLIRDLFADDYKKSDAASRVVLAQEILQQGLLSGEDESVQYTALLEAHELFTQAGDTDGCLRTADELSRLFEVDGVKMKLDGLRKLRRGLKSREAKTEMAWRFLRLGEELIRAKRFDHAKKAVAEALVLSKAAKSLPLTVTARSIRDRVEKALQLSRRLSRLEGAERSAVEREILSLAAHAASVARPEGHVSSIGAMFTGEMLAVAAGLRFADFVIPTDREWTYTTASVTAHNHSPTGRVSHDIKGRIRLLCRDADGKYSVIEYREDIMIAVKGEQEISLSGPRNKALRYYNQNSFVPQNAHLAVFFEGKVIYQSLWHKDVKSDVGRKSEKPWWQDEELLVEPK